MRLQRNAQSKTKTKEPISYDAKKKLWKVTVKNRVIGHYPRQLAVIVAGAYGAS